MSNIKPMKEWQMDRDLQDIIKKAKIPKRGLTVEKRLDNLEAWIGQYGDILRTLLAQRPSVA